MKRNMNDATMSPAHYPSNDFVHLLIKGIGRYIEDRISGVRIFLYRDFLFVTEGGVSSLDNLLYSFDGRECRNHPINDPNCFHNICESVYEGIRIQQSDI